MKGPMPERLKTKLRNLPPEILDTINTSEVRGGNWDEVEARIDHIIRQNAGRNICINCKVRTITVVKSRLCHRCYQYERRTGKKWESKSEICVMPGCGKPTRYSKELDGARLYLCATHVRRGNRRKWENWRCSNVECGGLPRKGEIYCTDCITRGKR